VKLFSEQRRRETAKLLQFLSLTKATFDYGSTTQRSASVRRHEGNSLVSKKDDFLNLIMQYLRFFFQERRKTGLFVSYDLLREEAIKARFFNIPQSCGVG
jgi:hypothetical protein